MTVDASVDEILFLGNTFIAFEYIFKVMSGWIPEELAFADSLSPPWGQRKSHPFRAGAKDAVRREHYTG
ncbi:MAG: hypothetical protein ACLQVG_32750 [Terriglobia bacterium]